MYTAVDDVNLAKKVSVLMDENTRRREEEKLRMRAELKPLANLLASARQSCQRPANVPSPAVHAQTISKLDDKRFGLVKAIEEGESALNDREAEYSRLKVELKELEEKDVTDEVELDGAAVRLNLYRELGFQWVEGKGDEEPTIIIRTESEDMHVVKVDDSLPTFEARNKLWELNAR